MIDTNVVLSDWTGVEVSWETSYTGPIYPHPCRVAGDGDMMFQIASQDVCRMVVQAKALEAQTMTHLLSERSRVLQ